MPGRGPAPKMKRVNPSDVPTRGEYKPAPGTGWQHGPIPEPPDVSAEAQEAWGVWMASWVAAHWSPLDVPGLRQTLRLLDQCIVYHADPIVWKQDDDGHWTGTRRPNPAAEYRQAAAEYGISPKGQQDRRWVAPQADAEKPARRKASAPYAHLRVAK